MAEPALQMPTRRDRQRAETRERLFLAACAEIDRVGLSDAQIPRIAAAAGVARATFYFHFPNKDDVLDELVGRLQGGLSDSLRQLDAEQHDLRDVIALLQAQLLQNRAFVGDSNLMREVLAAVVRRAQDELRPADPGMAEALATHFAAAAKSGAIRSAIDPERLSGILLASMFGLLLGRHPSDGDLEESLGLLVDLFLRGLEA